LGEKWKKARADAEVLTINISIWQALDEGIKKPTKDDGAGSVQEIFEENNIDCPFVSRCGACPGFLPRWFDEDRSELPDCEMCFKDSDTFMKEYMARFPKKTERFFAVDWLHNIASENKQMSLAQVAQLEEDVVIGVDLGGITDPTEIVINRWVEYDGIYHIETVGNYRIEAVKNDDGPKSIERIPEIIKDIYDKLKPCMVAPDVTGKEYVAKKLVQGKNAIPDNAIYTNDTAERNGLRGLWMTGQFKAKLFKNHRNLVAQGNLKIRGKNTDFWERYFKQHAHTTEDTSSRAKYKKFSMPKDDHLVDAAIYASIPVVEDDTGTMPTYGVEFVERD